MASRALAPRRTSRDLTMADPAPLTDSQASQASQASHVSNASHRRLPATGLPLAREDRRASVVVATLLHILVILWLIAPAALHTGDVKEIAQGAGGAGPAGGGGGGHSGTGGVREHVQYVQVTPPPAQATTPKPAVIPPV